ncbi:chromosomal replication initiator protein DnaA [Candidatus Dependentiae bacterium]|nr:chromosomal replication initiator protein DnaA [Candidatus Dependentiae bacterium]
MQLIWDEFLKIIKAEAGSQVVETWFKAVCLESWNPGSSLATLRVPNQFVSRWIQDHYIELLKTHLGRLLNTHTIRLSFEISPQKENAQRARTIMPASVIHDPELANEPIITLPLQHTRPAASSPPRPPVLVQHKSEELIISERATKKRTGSALNPTYQFDNFVVGPSNSLAHAAAYAICENIGKVYNPLFIYGGTGLGKTHLMHAIGNEVTKRNPDLMVRYETADTFINNFINSIRYDRSDQFRSRYQTVDLILFDDIQFLSNKEQTQESFFHIFNVLYEQQKQIVLSSDTFPKEIHGLQSRLKSRMEWGLVADIQTPDIETKIAILTKKSEAHHISLPEDVAEFIAARVVSNIRELEGALIRISAFASLTNQHISLEMARKVLLNLNEPKREGVMLETIIKVVAKHYDTGINDIRSKKRHQDISLVRQITFYLMKKMSNCSLQIIGSYVGGRDHSTVIHAIGKVEAMLAGDPTLGIKIKAMEQDILQS